MRENGRKVLAVVLSSAFIMSAASCSFLDKSSDEILDAAEPYAKNLASCNISKLVKSTVDDLKDDQDTWEERLDFSEGELYTADAATALNAIASTISYEIDEESVEADGKKGKGSIDVTFSIADYEAVLEDESVSKVEDFVDAVEDSKPKEIEITLEFEKDDDSWLCSNYEEVFDSLYAFTEAEYSFRVPVSEFLEGVNWYGCDWELGDGYYTNTTYIDVDLDLDWSADGLDYEGIYYIVEYGGSEIYTGEDTYIGTLYTYYDGAPVDDESGYLAAGTYTVTFYDVDNSVIWTGNATVYVEADPTPTPSPAPTPSDSGDTGIIIPGIIYYEAEAGTTFGDAIDQSASGWVDSDGNAVTSGIFYAADGEIAFDLYTSEDFGALEYRFLYCPEMVATEDAINDLGFVMISSEETDNGYVYHFTLSGDDVITGYYVLGIYNPDITGEVGIMAFAGVY